MQFFKKTIRESDPSEYYNQRYSSYSDTSEKDDSHAIIEPTQNDLDSSGVRRGLKSRHLSMMALAGIIGPGLLVGAGQALSEGGPASLLIGFGVVGLIAGGVMQSVGEMSTLFPEGGFVSHASRFINPAAGFTIGVNYVLVWVTVLANEYNALLSVLTTWNDNFPIYAYFLLFWAAFQAFQFAGVSKFGEAEFWLALIKILGLTAYFIFSIVYVSGGIHNHPAFGFHYFNDPGAFAQGFRGVAQVFVFCSTFYAGTESIAMAATETRNPGRAVPLAIRQTFFRILFVYMGSALFFGMTCPSTADELNSDLARALKSPMSVAIANAGWASGYHLINTFLLLTVLSGVNSCIFMGSRTLFFMSHEKLLPSFFKWTTKWGTPIFGVILINLFGFLSLLNMSEGAAKAYTYIVNLSGVSTFIVWAIIELTHLRFRYIWKQQGYTKSDLPFRDFLFPYSTFVVFVLCVFLTLVQSWTSFSPWNVGNFVDGYILIPVSLVCYLGFSLYKRQIRWNRVDSVDLLVGRRSDLDAVAAEPDPEAAESATILTLDKAPWWKNF